jgi:carbon-monoxide dehydrogenase medium subunit
VIPRFALVRPSTLADAFAAFAAVSGDAAWYAGGTELLQVMKMGLARPGTLVDLKGIAGLGAITVDDAGALVIGGGATHREIERSELVRRELPGLVGLEAHVANIRVRNQGTIGGNLCFAEPHSDPATFFLACDAHVRLEGPGGRRKLPMDAFLVSPFLTAREPDEIVTDVVIPAGAPGEGRAYEKAKFRERPAVSVAVRLRTSDGAIAEARVAVGSMTDIPIRVPAAETALVGVAVDDRALREALTAGAGADALGEIDAVGDLDGSPDYKRHLAGVLFGRAAAAALTEARAHA